MKKEKKKVIKDEEGRKEGKERKDGRIRGLTYRVRRRRGHRKG